MHMTRILATAITILFIGLLSVIGVRKYQQSHTQQPYIQGQSPDCSATVTIREQQLCVEIADTDAKRQQGLSGRDPLPVNAGMLFLFPKPAQHSFWMKDMKFALDFLWIRESRIVDITRNVPPPKPGTPLNQLEHYAPSEDVDAVLEVNAGTIASLGIATGDAVIRK